MPVISKLTTPDWADPAQASVMDPLYKTLARKAVSGLGLDDPSSGLMGVASPMMAAQESGGLLGALMKRVPSPLRYKTILNRAVSRVPEAEGMFEVPNSTVARSPGLGAQYQKQSSFNVKFKPSPEEGLMRQMLKGAYDRPAVKSLAELGDVAANASGSASAPAPALQRVMQNGASNPRIAGQLAKSGLTEDSIRALRAMPFEDAAAAYPNMNKETLRAIHRGDTFGWIR